MNFLLLINLFSKTGSTVATSFLWVSFALPAIIIGPFAAASVDMFNRKKILIITNLLQSLSIIFYSFSNDTGIFLIFGIAIVYSLLNQFYLPAESASLPSIVKKHELSLANGLFFLTQQIALILGFGSAGIILHFLGYEKSLFLCGILLFIAFISTLALPSIPVKDKITGNFEQAFFKFFKRIIEGYIYIKENRTVLVPLVTLLIFQVFLLIVMVNAPLIATDIIKVGVASAGLFIVVPAALGAGTGSILIPLFMKRSIRKIQIIKYSLSVLAISFFTLTAISYISKPETSIFISLISILLAGISYVGVIVPCLTFLQEKTLGGIRGRVFGNYWFLVTIVSIFPVIFSGAFTEIFGVRLLFLLIFLVILTMLFYSIKFGIKLLTNN